MEVSFPGDSALAVGASNLFDEDAPVRSASNNPFYFNTLHNPRGVVPDIRYRHEL
ncbi:MAG: hypothetical protein AB8G17_07560 [Gammaproteobacteria bacterium]